MHRWHAYVLAVDRVAVSLGLGEQGWPYDPTAAAAVELGRLLVVLVLLRVELHYHAAREVCRGYLSLILASVLMRVDLLLVQEEISSKFTRFKLAEWLFHFCRIMLRIGSFS